MLQWCRALLKHRLQWLKVLTMLLHEFTHAMMYKSLELTGSGIRWALCRLFLLRSAPLEQAGSDLSGATVAVWNVLYQTPERSRAPGAI